MHVRCPHCKNPIELVDAALAPEIVCAGCGSSFRLEEMSTTVWDEFTGKRFGKFEVLGTLGHGAFGTVLKARDQELDRTGCSCDAAGAVAAGAGCRASGRAAVQPPVTDGDARGLEDPRRGNVGHGPQDLGGPPEGQ